MALSTGAAALAEKNYEIDVLQKQKKQIEKTAKDAMKIKRDEISAIQSQLSIDVAAIQAQIDALG